MSHTVSAPNVDTCLAMLAEAGFEIALRGHAGDHYQRTHHRWVDDIAIEPGRAGKYPRATARRWEHAAVRAWAGGADAPQPVRHLVGALPDVVHQVIRDWPGDRV